MGGATVTDLLHVRVLPPTPPRPTVTALNRLVNFTKVSHDFWTMGVAVIDDLFSDEALIELRTGLLQDARFTRVRERYSEASPPTFQPAIMAKLAEELEAELPQVFEHAPLN